MKTEYEIRVLEINKDNIISKLENLGAVKKGEFNQRRYVYDLRPIEKGKWIRLRTNGKKTTLTYKDIVSNTIDGTKEVEMVKFITT
jgi:adenylate cyclase class IV